MTSTIATETVRPERNIPAEIARSWLLVNAMKTELFDHCLVPFDIGIMQIDQETAALADHEVELLYAIIRRLTSRGVAVIYVSHRLKEIFDLCDTITVLKDGRVVGTDNDPTSVELAHGNAIAYGLDRDAALRAVTLNPARIWGVDDVTGSREVGKDADVVIWSGDPFSVYSRAERVFIDGAQQYDRSDPTRQPRRDFMIGILPEVRR